MTSLSSPDVFSEHRESLVALACSIVGRPDIAEDVVQDSWIRWQGHSYPTNAAKPLLRKIAQNLARDWCRKEKRQATLLKTYAPDTADWRHGETTLIARQDLRQVVAALQTLPPNMLWALKLHRFDGLTFRPIGAAMDLSHARAFQLMTRALARAAMALEDTGSQTTRTDPANGLQTFPALARSGHDSRFQDVHMTDADKQNLFDEAAEIFMLIGETPDDPALLTRRATFLAQGPKAQRAYAKAARVWAGAHPPKPRSSQRMVVALVIVQGLRLGGYFAAEPLRIALTADLSGAYAPVQDLLGSGDVVIADAGSALRDATTPTRRGAVVLRGTAYFDVDKQDRPFIVELGDIRVQTLGTLFETALTRQGQTAAVLKGAVQVTRGTERWRLDAGEVLTLSGQAAAILDRRRPGPVTILGRALAETGLSGGVNLTTPETALRFLAAAAGALVVSVQLLGVLILRNESIALKTRNTAPTECTRPSPGKGFHSHRGSGAGLTSTGSCCRLNGCREQTPRPAPKDFHAGLHSGHGHAFLLQTAPHARRIEDDMTRTTFLTGTVSALGLMLVLTGTAIAQNRPLNIPAQPLSDALAQLAAQTGQQISAPA
ncbi:MAG: FecR domain-containing protein [Pseudomonadota bacterium]